MKVLLCIPPNYCFNYGFPPLGTPMIAGFLKERGVDVIQMDLNMEYLHYFAEKSLGSKKPLTTAELRIIFINTANQLYDIKRSKNYYYSGLLSYPPHYDTHDYKDHTNSSFYFTERLLSSEHLMKYIDDEKENTFLKFFQDKGILKRIEDEKIDIVGISIIAPSQVIGALTLGKMIKENLSNVHVTLGGQWPTLFRDEIMARPDWSVFFDTTITFEGETPFYKLIKSLESKGEFSKVPNLIYFEDGGWVKSISHTRENLNELACPDFDDLPLTKYAGTQALSRGTNLPYQTSRECYWNKCIFCVDLPLPKQGYRERHPELVIKDMRTLIKKYDLGHLEISNATFSPVQMRRISKRVSEEGFKFEWWTMARLDKEFTRETLGTAREAGCDCIMFGLESGSQRVLDLVKKGINLKTAERIIKDCFDVGIAAGVQMMTGLPSETIEEAMDTIKFLLDNEKYIRAGATFNTYYVTPACEAYLNPSQYGLKIKKDPALPFQFLHEYSHITPTTHTAGKGELTPQKAKALVEAYNILIERMPQKDK